MSIDLKETQALTVASVESTGSFEDVGRVFMELFRWVLHRGGKVTSYPMALFPALPGEIPAEGVRFEACIPVDPSGGLVPGEGVTIKQLPESRVVFTRHHGAYGEVGRTYDELLRWISDNGYEVGGPSRELYLTNPMQTPEEERVTEVQIPVTPVSS